MKGHIVIRQITVKPQYTYVYVGRRPIVIVCVQIYVLKKNTDFFILFLVPLYLQYINEKLNMLSMVAFFHESFFFR